MLALVIGGRGGRRGAGHPFDESVEVIGGGDGDGVDVVEGPFRHPGEDAAGPEFGEGGDAHLRHGEEPVLPPDGARQLGRQQAGPVVGVVVRLGVDVRDDRQVAAADGCDGDRIAEAVAGRHHERGVEGTGHL